MVKSYLESNGYVIWLSYIGNMNMIYLNGWDFGGAFDKVMDVNNYVIFFGLHSWYARWLFYGMSWYGSRYWDGLIDGLLDYIVDM